MAGRRTKRSLESDAGKWNVIDELAVYREQGHRLAGDARLRLAVILDALELVMTGPVGRDRAQAAAWILSDQQEHPLSFENICTEFKINPNAAVIALEKQYQLSAMSSWESVRHRTRRKRCRVTPRRSVSGAL